MQGILLQVRYFERELSKSFKKVNFIFLSNRISFVCSNIRMTCGSKEKCTRMHSYVIRMSLVCTRIYSYAIRISLYATRMYLYVIRTRMHSYVIRMSLVSIRISSVCHSYVIVCHSYVTRMWFYHEPLTLSKVQ